MDIHEVRLRRKFNLGNYETLDVEIAAYVNAHENPQEVLTHLQQQINKWVGGHVKRSAPPCTKSGS